jgi:hypothetical protein
MPLFLLRYIRSWAHLSCYLLTLLSISAATQNSAVSSVPDKPQTLLFIGNSFMFGALSPVRFYRAQSVTDLNAEHMGGVPALFKTFASEAQLNYIVSLETIRGAGLDSHLKTKQPLIVKPWDHVVMLGYSLLDRNNPGNPALLIKTVKQMADLLHTQNSDVDIRLISTWPRADQIYPAKGSWYGKSVSEMAHDIRLAYNLARTNSPYVYDVIAVGEAWNKAIEQGIADPNPYDGIAAGQIDLWGYDNYHASAFGYYLEALMVFGDLTGLDPRSLGKKETCAYELGFSPDQTASLQRIAYEQLNSDNAQRSLKPFTVSYLNPSIKIDEISSRAALGAH